MAAFPEEVIFQIARQIDRPEARQLYLDQVCGADDAVRARINALLRVHDEERSFLEHPAVSPPVPGLEAPTVPPGELPPTAAFEPPPVSAGAFIAGRFKLLEEIGEGGMGSVWMAEQTEPIQRRVAIKLIKPGMDSRQVVARFEAERQALALMDHPNIAKVLDGGATPDGRPYFVMELVKGTPITKFCDEKKLKVQERLELFGDVCRAVQHAHQKGIIHRDLKPSNVLVAPYDGRTVVKVIDFGVAKATGQKLTEATLFTGFGAVVGTPEYMSPEQAEINNQDIDTRSDIYSLGVLLYELLTGSTPLTRKRAKDAAFLEVLRVIREEEPPKPSTRLSSTEELPSISAQRQSEPAKLTKLVRGELDWIVMKALEKDRNRRYETANGFAMDVQRYLADEPVQACPPSAGYRLRKFARRNRGRLVVASVLAMAALVATSGIGWAIRDRSARQAEAERERDVRWAKVRTQVDLILADADRLMESQKWPEALTTAQRAEAALAGGEADNTTREKVEEVIRDLRFVERLERIRMTRLTIVDGKLETVPTVREYRAVFYEMGLDLVSPASFDAFLGRWSNRPAFRVPVAAALDGWGNALRDHTKANSNQADRITLAGIARRLDPDPLRDRIRGYAVQPNTPELQAEIRVLTEGLDVRQHRAETLLALSSTLDSLGLHEVQLHLLRRIQNEHPGDFWIAVTLAGRLAKERPAEAEMYSRVGVSVRPSDSRAHECIGLALFGQGKSKEAITCFRRAIELDALNATAQGNLGFLLFLHFKTAEAIACYQKAIEIDPRLVQVHKNLAAALLRQRRQDEAIACFHMAIELEPTDSRTHYLLGDVLQKQGKLDEAISCYRKSIELDPADAFTHIGLARAYSLSGKRDMAIASFRSAVKHAPGDYVAWTGLGEALSSKGDHVEAVECFQKALAILPKHKPALIGRSNSLSRLGKDVEAISAFRKILETERNGTQRAYALNGLAWLLLTSDATPRDTAEALRLSREAVEIEPEKWPYLDTYSLAAYRNGSWKESLAARESMIKLRPPRTEDRFFLAMTHWHLGNHAEARKWWAEALTEFTKQSKPTSWLSEIKLEAETLIRDGKGNMREQLTIPPRAVK